MTTLSAIKVVGKVRDVAGSDITLASDPDAVRDPATGKVVLAWHSTSGGQNVIAASETSDGAKLDGQHVVVLRPEKNSWNWQGCETPSLAPPTANLPLWTWLRSTYPNYIGDLPSPVAGREHRWKGISMAVSTTWKGPAKWVHRAPVLAPCSPSTMPYVGNDKLLDGGLDEPTHVVTGKTAFGLAAGTSYALGQSPSLHLIGNLDLSAFGGRMWWQEPDPVLTEAPPSWVSQPDLVVHQDGRMFVLACKKLGAGEGCFLYEAEGKDLHKLTMVGTGPLVQTTTGTFYSARCFGPCGVIDGNTLRMWFSGRPTNAPGNDWHLGYAEAGLS